MTLTLEEVVGPGPGPIYRTIIKRMEADGINPADHIFAINRRQDTGAPQVIQGTVVPPTSFDQARLENSVDSIRKIFALGNEDRLCDVQEILALLAVMMHDPKTEDEARPAFCVLVRWWYTQQDHASVPGEIGIVGIFIKDQVCHLAAGALVPDTLSETAPHG